MAKRIRVNKQKLFELLHYEPHPGQLLVHQSNAPRRVVACGVRWGKSLCGSMEALAAALQPAQSSVGWIVAPTYDLADRVFREIQIAALTHMRHRVLQIDEKDHLLLLRNGSGGKSEIRSKSADNPVSLLGAGLDWLVVDEAARLKREIWERFLSQRLIDKRGWALLLSTPSGVNWFFRMFRRGLDGRVPGYESWCAPSWQNPHLQRAVIDAERANLDAQTFAQEYGAEFVGRDLEPCLRCGGPSKAVSGLAVVKIGRPIPRCTECSGHVNEEGRTIMTRDGAGNPILSLILFPDDGKDGVFVKMPPHPESIAHLLTAAKASERVQVEDEKATSS